MNSCNKIRMIFNNSKKMVYYAYNIAQDPQLPRKVQPNQWREDWENGPIDPQFEKALK